MKTKFLLLALAAMMVLPISATKPTDLKYPNGVKIPMKEVPTMSFGGRPRIQPYSLDGLFAYEVILSERMLVIVLNEDIETTYIRIEKEKETIYTTAETTLSGDLIEISLDDWQQGNYTLILQNKYNILKGEFTLR